MNCPYRQHKAIFHRLSRSAKITKIAKIAHAGHRCRFTVRH